MDSDSLREKHFIRSKFLHLFSALLVLFISIALVVCCIFTVITLKDYDVFLKVYTGTSLDLIFIISVIGILITSLAIYGNIKGNTVISITHGALLSVMFVVEVIIAVLFTYFYTKGLVNQDINTTLTANYKDYNITESITQNIDFLQTKLKCCGANDTHSFDEIGFIPKSCCPSAQTELYYCRPLEDFNNIFDAGCLDKILDVPNYMRNMIASLWIALLLSQIFLMVVSAVFVTRLININHCGT